MLSHKLNLSISIVLCIIGLQIYRTNATLSQAQMSEITQICNQTYQISRGDLYLKINLSIIIVILFLFFYIYRIYF